MGSVPVMKTWPLSVTPSNNIDLVTIMGMFYSAE